MFCPVFDIEDGADNVGEYGTPVVSIDDIPEDIQNSSQEPDLKQSVLNALVNLPIKIIPSINEPNHLSIEVTKHCVIRVVTIFFQDPQVVLNVYERNERTQFNYQLIKSYTLPGCLDLIVKAIQIETNIDLRSVVRHHLRRRVITLGEAKFVTQGDTLWEVNIIDQQVQIFQGSQQFQFSESSLVNNLIAAERLMSSV